MERLFLKLFVVFWRDWNLGLRLAILFCNGKKHRRIVDISHIPQLVQTLKVRSCWLNRKQKCMENCLSKNCLKRIGDSCSICFTLCIVELFQLPISLFCTCRHDCDCLRGFSLPLSHPAPGNSDVSLHLLQEQAAGTTPQGRNLQGSRGCLLPLRGTNQGCGLVCLPLPPPTPQMRWPMGAVVTGEVPQVMCSLGGFGLPCSR